MPEQSHYVNNQELLHALIEHKKATREAKKQKIEPPPISEYIGLCFLKIAEHLSRKPNFMSYSFREDMVADAVENSIQYVNNFNPSKSKNPFAYFTQIIYFAFLRRISKEKKQLYVKYKATEQLGLLQDAGQSDRDQFGQEGNHPFRVYENISDFIQTFEKGRTNKKHKKKKSTSRTHGVLRFVGDK